jgi:hypothetical protein
MIFDAEAALFEALDQSDLRPIQKMRIRLAVRYRPAVRAEVLGAVQMQCCMQGLVSEGGEVEAAVDWQAVIDAIVKYLPAILSIIMLFI